jgi:hypothetical protein
MNYFVDDYKNLAIMRHLLSNSLLPNVFSCQQAQGYFREREKGYLSASTLVILRERLYEIGGFGLPVFTQKVLPIAFKRFPAKNMPNLTVFLSIFYVVKKVS